MSNNNIINNKYSDNNLLLLTSHIKNISVESGQEEQSQQ